MGRVEFSSTATRVRTLLATPLFQWYLDKGLQVTKIYKVIEYQANSCLQKFGDAVSDARCKADRNHAETKTSETMKLPGNAA